MTPDVPGFAHLVRLTDDTGLLEHARHAVVRREHGYCTDDVARGLLVISREPHPDPQLVEIAGRYLAFLTHAQDGTGAFHNRLDFGRQWIDAPSLGDCWGRAMWGLGTAVGRRPAGWIAQEALVAFDIGADQRSPWRRAMAFAGLGAAEVLRGDPDHKAAALLLADAAEAVGVPGVNPEWPWPEERLTYANAAPAEVLILAGQLLGNAGWLADGLRMLTWLWESQTTGGHLSVVPVRGRRRGAAREHGDQQPIEVAALADAFATAAAVTGDRRWLEGVRHAVEWFQGSNDAGSRMWDPETHGGYDGLALGGPNLNQGAESTLALLSTMQHARRLT